jgi:hypothetical protein
MPTRAPRGLGANCVAGNLRAANTTPAACARIAPIAAASTLP